MAKVQIIGIYGLPINEEIVVSQAKILWGDDFSPEGLAQCRAQLQSVALIEVLVADIDDKFKVGGFAQEISGQPRGNWQAPWAEAFLTPDGSELLVERWGSPPKGATAFRVAFFMHFWQAGQPLLFGDERLATPQPTTMPERLERLAPYVQLD